MCTFYPAFILLLFLHNGYITGLSSWPDGRYGLLKPITGCPEEWSGKSWENTCTSSSSSWCNNWEYRGWGRKGLIYQETAGDGYVNDTNSESLHFDGCIGSDFVLRKFCVKITDVKQSSTRWPKGEYCIYTDKTGGEMEWGDIEMCGMDRSYEHTTKYVDGFINDWHGSITFAFACQTSGDKKIPISLPITKPFYLLPYGSRDCQQVEWMVATSEWIKYHTNNYDTKSGKQADGTVPYHELGDRNHTGITMYYCYYESCNYTLNDTSGVFQSPGFPGKYPDGQLCSWKFKVPTNHTVQVQFTHFSLYGYTDSLQFYKTINGLFTLDDNFNGNRYPRTTLTATSDIKFVFSTDRWYNSTGFRAQYKVFDPNKITTTPLATTTKLPKPTTAGKPPTATKLPTTKTIHTNKPTNKPHEPITQQAQTKNNEPTRKITQTTQWYTSNNGASNKFKGSSPLFSCDMTSKIAVMVIPLVCCILIIVVVVDIVYRCRHTTNKGKPKDSRNGDDFLAVNVTYERGVIILDQPDGTSTDTSTVNTVNEQPQSRDEPPDYEDVDYTQVDEVPPPRRSMKRQECHALQSVGNSASAVFCHVLEPPKTESQDQPQSRVPEPVGNGVREMFYTLEPSTESDRPTYQNLSELNHYT